MDLYEIQTKIDGKWSTRANVESDGEGALRIWRYEAGRVTAPARLIRRDYKGRVRVIAMHSARRGYLVTYGETLPVWTRLLATRSAAEAFAAKQRSMGDIVFSIEPAG